jgi:hypothetical protein
MTQTTCYKRTCYMTGDNGGNTCGCCTLPNCSVLRAGDGGNTRFGESTTPFRTAGSTGSVDKLHNISREYNNMSWGQNKRRVYLLPFKKPWSGGGVGAESPAEVGDGSCNEKPCTVVHQGFHPTAEKHVHALKVLAQPQACGCG